ncbi:TPA: polyketide synthase dehydratase domain-containing protein [Bacillus cereus]|nr:polyketide synthase dehydratase domain-containing protein [Bacillus cereus]
MSEFETNRKNILRLVRDKRINPEQGFYLLKSLYSENITVKSEIEMEGQTNKKQEETGRVHQTELTQDMDIAIIGIAGQFPKSRNIHEFWNNLKGGIDCISDIPHDRWNIDQFYDPNPETPGKTYSKWGGFLSEADLFDPLFFNITPMEAETMDPQQRLVLQESWRALEDAGYPPESLSGSRCGMYTGVIQTHYDWMLKRSDKALDGQFITSTATGFPSARVAYTLNLMGPTMSIDTACSSSLVAIHLACNSIRNGESDLMLAGGVNMLPSPDTYIMCSNSSMLAKDGRCKAFDNSADGFVPAEGVGVIVLKSLRQALKDKDHIYGVIKGSAVNQDGKTNGITAPSKNAQERLETDLYKQFHINPETISYMEAHGTGTKLGDPIELSALKSSFSHYTNKKQYCAIGSVKTNIGHLFGAAGIAGLTKILLSMKYQKLVPSLHLKKINEHLELTNSPFFINTELIDWKPQNFPLRRAAISSFGFGGTNCHMVIEEPPEVKMNQKTKGIKSLIEMKKTPYFLIPVSAKTKLAHREKWEQLSKWLDEHGSMHSIQNIAFTLLAGRSHYNIRSAIIAKDVSHLKQQISLILENSGVEHYFYGELKRGHTHDKEQEQNLLKAIKMLQKENLEGSIEYQKQLRFIADLYVKGYDVEAKHLYQNEDVHRISMPTYPFARERYWVTDQAVYENTSSRDSMREHGRTEKLHPLLDENVSTIEELCFVKKVSNEEFYLRDYEVTDEMLLPGMMYLEMARIAGERINPASRVTCLRQVNWSKPLARPGSEFQLRVCLFPKSEGIVFEVSMQESKDVRKILCQGILGDQVSNLENEKRLDLVAIQNKCANRYSSEFIYSKANQNGMRYGSLMRAIDTIYTNGKEALARLQLPADLQTTFDEFVLHPTLMESALLATMTYSERDTVFVPFSLKWAEVREPLALVSYVHVKQLMNNSESMKYDINFAAEDGRILATFHELTIKEIAVNKNSRKSPQLLELLQRLERGEVEDDEVNHITEVILNG